MIGTRNTLARTRLKSVMFKTVTSLIVAAGLALFAAPAAMAAPVAGYAQTVTAVTRPSAVSGTLPSAAVATCTATAADGKAGNSDYLPINRWNGSSSVLHVLSTGDLDVTSTVNKFRQQGIVSGILSFGNSIMSATAGLTSVAVTFCPMEQAGGLIDQLAGTLGSIITTTPLGVLILAVVIVSVAISTIKNGFLPLKTILVKGAIFGILAVMVTGAMASTGAGVQNKGSGAQGSTDQFAPGPLSPGWFLTNLNTVVSALASGPAAFLTTFTPFGTATEPSNNTLSCDSYVKGMKKGYQNTFAAGFSDMKTGIPLIINGEFEQTGLRAWRTAQFGSDLKPSNGQTTFDDQAWCRILDWNAGATGGAFKASIDRSGVTSPDSGSPVWKSKAFVPATEDDKDRSLLAWSACLLDKNANGDWGNKANWTVLDSFTKGEKPIGPEQCADWMTNPKSDLANFQTDTRFDYVNDNTGNPEAANYINTIHGNSNADAAVQASFSYPIAALAVLLSFGSVAAGVIVAKALMMILMIAIVAVLIAMLLPGRRGDKVMQVFSMSIGMTLFVFGAQLIFSLLALLAAVISGIGVSILGGMDLLKVLWVGLAPLMAAGILSYIFKMVGLPNPLSIKGALDWGNHMSKGGGGAMLGGASGMLDRVASKPKSVLSGEASRLKGGIANIGKRADGTTGGPGGPRKGAASPVGAGVGGSLGAGVGAGDETNTNTTSPVVGSDEERSGMSEPAELDAAAAADLLGTRNKTRDEKKAEKAKNKILDEEAKNWASGIDPKATNLIDGLPGDRFLRGVGNALDPRKSKTAKLFREQGLGAASKHFARKALINTAIVGGAVLAGPVGVGIAGAVLAVNGARAYRAQGRRIKDQQASVTQAYSENQKRKKSAEKAAEKAAGSAPAGVAPEFSETTAPRTPDVEEKNTSNENQEEK
jgi:hypothetical protein